MVRGPVGWGAERLFAVIPTRHHSLSRSRDAASRSPGRRGTTPASEHRSHSDAQGVSMGMHTARRQVSMTSTAGRTLFTATAAFALFGGGVGVAFAGQAPGHRGPPHRRHCCRVRDPDRRPDGGRRRRGDQRGHGRRHGPGLRGRQGGHRPGARRGVPPRLGAARRLRGVGRPGRAARRCPHRGARLIEGRGRPACGRTHDGPVSRVSGTGAVVCRGAGLRTLSARRGCVDPGRWSATAVARAPRSRGRGSGLPAGSTARAVSGRHRRAPGAGPARTR